MALGSDVKKQQIKPEDLADLLEALEKLLDRAKVLYEQYFMGIQKLAPMQLHRDIERKVRELTQQQIRNTALRFRFTTISQKFGSYNTYWKRTMREIEQGKYVRDLARVKRKAEQAGEELPEELLVKLPKRMQDRIRRDRERLAERATEREAEARPFEATARAAEAPAGSTGQHVISEEEADSLFQAGDLDIDELFNALTEQPDPPEATDAAAAGKQRARGRPTTASTVEASAAPAVDDESAVEATDESSAEEDAAPARTIAVAIPKAPPRSRPIPVLDGFRVPPPPGMSRAGTAPPREDTPGQPSSTSIKAPTVAARPAPPPIPPAARPAPPRPPTVPGMKPPPPARPVISSAPRPTGPPPPPGMDDKQCRDLYTRYLKARQLVGERNDDVTYEKLVNSLGKQAATIMTEHNARGVEFHVVVRGDKVVLKAKPIKPEPGPGARPGSKSEK